MLLSSRAIFYIYIQSRSIVRCENAEKESRVRSNGKVGQILISEKTHKKLFVRIAEDEITIQYLVADLIANILVDQLRFDNA